MQFSEKQTIPLKPGKYEIDEFNNNPLFAVKKSNCDSKLVVDNWWDAYSLLEKTSSNDVNPKYIAEFLTNTYSTETSPYKKVIRLPRCSIIKINKNGNVEIKKRDPFLSKYKQLQKEELLDLVRTKLIKLLKEVVDESKYNIGIEHSSGLDSNSIIGCLFKVDKFNKNKIHTFSRNGINEIERIRLLRTHFGLELKNCHVSYHEPQLNEAKISLEKLGFPSIISHDIQAIKVFKNNDCSHILSGLGGDQCLSNSGKNIINDFINEGSWYLASKWLGGYLYLLRFLLRKQFRNYLLGSKLSNLNKMSNFYIEKAITNEGRNFLYPYLNNKNKKDEAYYSHHNSLKNGLLSEWLSLRCEQEKNLAQSYGIRKIYPLLNIDLLNLVLKQKQLLFADNHYSGRKILKDSMSTLLPNDMNFDKNYESNDIAKEERRVRLKKQKFEFLEDNLNNKFELHKLTKTLFNLENIYRIGEKALKSNNLNYFQLHNLNLTFDKIRNLNMWFSYLDNENLNK